MEQHTLKIAIFENGYKSIKEFAEKSGVDRTAIIKIMQGKTTNAQGNTIMKIANALNLSYIEASALCDGKEAR